MPAMLHVIALASEGGGFNPLDVAQGGNYLWTLVIFFAAVPFIWMVVMGPVTRALLARDQKAAEAILSAERASEEAQKAKAEVEVALGRARADAAELLAAARARAETREGEIVDSARREADAMVERAREEIRGEREKALAQIREQVVDLSLGAASRVLGRSVGSEDDRRLVRELVAGASGAAAGPAGKGGRGGGGGR
jgi:F-type H+-transporting ATPase subunit b